MPPTTLDKLCCPNNHALQRTTDCEGRSLICDNCSQKFTAGRASFGCKRCDYDEECDQIIPVDDTCPTADRVVSSEFDSSYLFDLIDDAEAEGEGGGRGGVYVYTENQRGESEIGAKI